MTDEPQSAADPRPDGVPYYIENECENCGGELELWDMARPNDGKLRVQPWYDEWTCPDCLDGIYLDWPEQALDDLEARMDEYDEDEDYVTLEEAAEELDIGLDAAEEGDTAGLDEILDDINDDEKFAIEERAHLLNDEDNLEDIESLLDDVWAESDDVLDLMEDDG